jgi:hypothetical protein
MIHLAVLAADLCPFLSEFCSVSQSGNRAIGKFDATFPAASPKQGSAMRLRYGVLTCVVLSTLVVGQLGAQRTRSNNINEWERQVAFLLAADDEAASRLGLTPTHDPYANQLRNNTYDDVTVLLRAYKTYRIAGVCDADCTDLDFKLYDENWNLIDSDTEPDDTPEVDVTPEHTATFHLRVIMVRCRINPCWYGVRVYGNE